MAVLAVGLALASPANAANVFVEVIDFGQTGCDATYRTTVDARPGETNTVTMQKAEALSVPAPVGSCGEGIVLAWPQVLVTDATAPLFPLSNGGCEYAGGPSQNRLVTCSGSQYVGAFLKDGDDRLVVETMRAVVNAGPGNDHVEVLSPATDQVRCGDGVDTVVAGRGDHIDPDCEQVSRLG
jgi:hypothetical protein